VCVGVFKDCTTFYLITKFSAHEYGADIVGGVSQRV
jgi:hypothetical protein